MFKKGKAKRLANLVRKTLKQEWWDEGDGNPQSREEVVNQVCKQREQGDVGMKCLIIKTGKKGSHPKCMHTNEEVLREQYKGKLSLFSWEISMSGCFSEV